MKKITKIILIVFILLALIIIFYPKKISKWESDFCPMFGELPREPEYDEYAYCFGIPYSYSHEICYFPDNVRSLLLDEQICKDYISQNCFGIEIEKAKITTCV